MVDKERLWDAINGEKSKNNGELKEYVEKYVLQYLENQISRDELVKKLQTSEYTKILSDQQINGLLKIVDSKPLTKSLSSEIGLVLDETNAFWLNHINEYVLDWGMLQVLDDLHEGEEKQLYKSLLDSYIESKDISNMDVEDILAQSKRILESAELKGNFKAGKTLLDVGTGEKGTYGLLFQSLGYKDITLQDVSSVNIEVLKKAQVDGKISPDIRLKAEDIINADETIQYDTIVANFVVHHIESKEDKQCFFDKIFNLLKPGGKALVSFFMPNSDCVNGDKESFPSFYDNHPVSNISHENFVQFIEHTFGSNYRFLGNGIIKGKKLFYGTYELTKV